MGEGFQAKRRKLCWTQLQLLLPLILYGVAVPANTPKDIVMRLNTEIVNALKSSDVRDRLNNEGIEARSNSPDEMTAFAKSEYARWGKVIKSAGIKPE